MNIFDKFGLTPIVGTIGAFCTFSLSKINEYLAVAIGLATLVYTVMKCLDLYRQMKK